eukprot:500858-Rhodomonas_salina.1
MHTHTHTHVRPPSSTAVSTHSSLTQSSERSPHRPPRERQRASAHPYTRPPAAGSLARNPRPPLPPPCPTSHVTTTALRPVVLSDCGDSTIRTELGVGGYL